ncbi:MAG: sulfotransferase [Pirellulaceae bacterium]
MCVDEITIDEVETLANEATGLSDFGPSHYRDGLEVFLESLAVDGPMHKEGVRIMRDLIVLTLSNRLKWVDWVGRHPGIDAQPLTNAPIFIVGTARSGTTLLYNLMSHHPEVRCPVFWETLDPIPPAWNCDGSTVNERIAAMDEFLRDYNEGLPQFKAIHYFHSATQVEECNTLLYIPFKSPTKAFAVWPGPRYYRWLASQSAESMRTAFSEYRSLVHLLARSAPDKTWLTKCPMNAPYTHCLHEAFPTARIVHTHRDCRERLPSLCNLNRHLHSVYREPTINGVREQVLFYNQLSMESMSRARVAHPDDTFDIDYPDLVADPVKTVATLCESLGLSVTERFLADCQSWLDSRNPYDAKKVGKHEYDAKTFGLDLEELAKLEP